MVQIISVQIFFPNPEKLLRSIRYSTIHGVRYIVTGEAKAAASQAYLVSTKEKHCTENRCGYQKRC